MRAIEDPTRPLAMDGTGRGPVLMRGSRRGGPRSRERASTGVLLFVAVAACATPGPALPDGVAIAESRDFGRVYVGTARQRTFRVRNDILPARDLVVTSSAVDTNTVFRAAGPHPPPIARVRPGEVLDLTFVFTPPGLGPFNETWYLTLDGQPYDLRLDGRGVRAAGENLEVTGVLVDPERGLDFGDVLVGEFGRTSIAITVVPTAPSVNVSPPRIEQATAGIFTISSARVSGMSADLTGTRALFPNDRFTIALAFTPGEAVRYQGTLIVEDGAGNVVFRIHLVGQGVGG